MYRKVGREAYQGGGEDGEEDAEAEDDAVARRLGEDRDAAEEAVFGKSCQVPRFSLSRALLLSLACRGNAREAKGHQATEMRTCDWIGRFRDYRAWSGSWGVRVKPHLGSFVQTPPTSE